MHHCDLDFYGYRIAIESPNEKLLDHLSRDFAFFRVAESVDPEPSRESDLRLVGHHVEPDYSTIPDMPVTSISPRNLLFRDGDTSYLDYFGRGLLIERPEQTEAYTCDIDMLREIFYLYILSKVGLYLDRGGLHRLHAAAFSFGDRAMVLMCPSGSGKSTTTFNLIQREGYRMLSEDSPVITSQGDILPFPLCLGCKSDPPSDIPGEYIRRVNRMEFAPKYLIDLDYFRDKLESRRLQPGPLIVGLRHSGQTSSIEPLSKPAFFRALMRDLVVGIGIYQGVEFLFQSKIYGLVRHALVMASRTRAALSLARRGDPYLFRMGRDISKNIETLDQFIRSQEA